MAKQPIDKKKKKTMAEERQTRSRQKNPEWAAGLRRLYDQVVEEPLPDSFTRLLDQLDAGDNG